MEIALSVNGREVVRDVAPQELLLDFLRDTLALTGTEVTTIEGLAERPEFARIEEIFTRHASLQCGFCTPGMLLTVSALLDSGELKSEEQIKHNLAGNLCRCTGYRGILEAVAELAAAE